MCRSHHTRQKYPSSKVYNNALSYFHQPKLSMLCLQEEFELISCYYAHVIGTFTLYVMDKMAEVVTILQERENQLSLCVCVCYAWHQDR